MNGHKRDVLMNLNKLVIVSNSNFLVVVCTMLHIKDKLSDIYHLINNINIKKQPHNETFSLGYLYEQF